MTTGSTRRRAGIGSWAGHRRIAWVAAAIIAVTIAAPVEAYETKTRILFRDGQILVIEQDVGNQAFQ